MKQYKNTVQTIQNTVNTSTYITKTPTHTPRERAGRPTCERGGNQQRNQRVLQKDPKKSSVK